MPRKKNKSKATQDKTAAVSATAVPAATTVAVEKETNQSQTTETSTQLIVIATPDKEKVVAEVNQQIAAANDDIKTKRDAHANGHTNMSFTLNPEVPVNEFYRNGDLLQLERSLHRMIKDAESQVQKEQEKQEDPQQENPSIAKPDTTESEKSLLKSFCQAIRSIFDTLLKKLSQFFSWIKSMLFPQAKPVLTLQDKKADEPTTVLGENKADKPTAALNKQKATPSTPFFDEKKAALRFFGTEPKLKQVEITPQATPQI